MCFDFVKDGSSLLSFKYRLKASCSEHYYTEIMKNYKLHNWTPESRRVFIQVVSRGSATIGDAIGLDSQKFFTINPTELYREFKGKHICAEYFIESYTNLIKEVI